MDVLAARPEPTAPAAKGEQKQTDNEEDCLEASLGSACSSAELAPSYVLEAMGLSRDEAARSLRLSPGRFTSAAEALRAADSLARVAVRVRDSGVTMKAGASEP